MLQKAAELSLSTPLQMEPSPPHSQLPVAREDVELDIEALQYSPPHAGRAMCGDGGSCFPLENQKMW